MDISEEDICQTITEICRTFNWRVSPKKFQQDFFVKAVAGVSGFLEVFLLVIYLSFISKNVSSSYLLLSSFPNIEYPVVLVVEPLTAISESRFF